MSMKGTVINLFSTSKGEAGVETTLVYLKQSKIATKEAKQPLVVHPPILQLSATQKESFPIISKISLKSGLLCTLSTVMGQATRAIKPILSITKVKSFILEDILLQWLN